MLGIISDKRRKELSSDKSFLLECLAGVSEKLRLVCKCYVSFAKTNDFVAKYRLAVL